MPQKIVVAHTKETIGVRDGVLDVMCMNESCHMYECVMSQEIVAAHTKEMIEVRDGVLDVVGYMGLVRNEHDLMSGSLSMHDFEDEEDARRTHC